MKNYKPRLSDGVLEKKLRAKGAVLVEGAKWCGKTTSCLQLSKSVLYVQNPATRAQTLLLSDVNPGALLSGETPRLIDEWQLVPKLWDAIRFESDMRDDFGQFLLTGSAVPAGLDEISHSGTGRISRMRMRPMSLFESGESSGEVSLRSLFEQSGQVSAANALDLERLAFCICRGGWPKAIDCGDDIALFQATDYFDGLIHSDISRVDGVRRDPESAAKILRVLARAVGTSPKISGLLADLDSSDERLVISDRTLQSYVAALKKIFVLESSPAWNPNLRSKTAVRSAETLYFTDPSIGIAALGIGPGNLLADLETLGFYLENLCIRDLRIYADTLGGSVAHYRDRNGLECDAVIRLPDGRFGLVEIKLGGDRLINEGAKTLTQLTQKLVNPPAFRMVLVGVGPYAYQRPDGVYVVPIGCLRD